MKWASLGTCVGLCMMVLGQGPVAHAQQQPSLAELAKREQARRDSITEKSRVYTNDDLLGGPRLTTRTPPSGERETESRDSGMPADPDDAVVIDASADQEAERDEDYWRERITTARDARRRAELMAAALQNRVDGLWADFTARDDPFQRAQIEQDRIAALQELENTRAEMIRLDQQIRDI